jgi:hypothetical protein
MDDTHCFHCWVVGLGSQEEVKKFGSRIKFYGSKENALFEGPVISIDRSTLDVIDERIGLVLSDEFIRRIWDGNQVKYELNLFEYK